MRPHKLKMSAFGPFAQETVVDFDKMGNNIFLISGDTGIGKTTIFDGMIYALYGKASGGGRSSLGTEALHSDYCKDGKHKDKMEVSFTFSNAGRMYTVVREMSWGKNGNNQTAVKESTLLENNSVMIHAKGREDRDEVTLKIQEILGLDADQFRRIIMLAQGEFQKFLTSGSDDRGKILGKLFDNRRHIDLQLRLKAAYKMVDSKIKDNSSNIRAQIEAFIFPQDHAAETDQLTADNPDLLSIMDSVIKSLSQESENISDAIVTTNAGLLELNKEMTRAENNNKRLAELDREKSAFDRLQLQNGVIDAMKKKVEPAKAAKELVPLERTLHSAADDLDRIKKNIERLAGEKKIGVEKLSQLQTDARVTEERNLPQIERNTKQQHSLENILHIYDELKEVENSRLQIKRNFDSSSQNVLRIQQTLNEKKHDLEQVLGLLAQLENAGDLAVNEAQRLLVEQRKRKPLLTDIESQIKNLSEQEKKLSALKDSILRAQMAAHEAEGKHYQLNGAFLSGQAGLLAQEMRKELQTKPETVCPVCGTKHTAADTDAFARWCEDIPTREQVDAAFAAWNAAREQETALKNKYSDQKAAYDNSLQTLLTHSSELLGVSDKDTLWQRTALQLAHQRCDAAIAGYESDYKKAVDDRQKKNNAVQEKMRLEQETERLSTALSLAQEQMQKVSGQKSAADARADEKRRELAGWPAAQQEALAIIADLKKKTEALQEQTDHAKTLYTDYQKKLENIEGRLTNAEAEKLSAVEKVHKAKLDYEAGLVRYGFDNDDVYRSAKSPDGRLLEPDELDRWIRNADRTISDHTMNCLELSTKIKQLEKETINCVKTDLHELKEKIRLMEQNLQAMRNRDKELDAQLRINTTAYKNISIYLKERKRYLAAAEKLKPLSDTANGNYTFSRYVLSGFFRRIIDQANIHLDVMTDGEYSLVPKETGDGRRSVGLDLKIYNSITHQERETASLSGGQLFEASLSLALGLSDIVQMESSSTIQIDSMFIDEGFGSLDISRLDKAIEVLKHLSAGKRQIGIISHVSRLDECLPKKIHVIKRADGRGSEIRIETDE